MKHSKIRKEFTKYFEKNGHKDVESSSLIPHDDPTLMFTNAGMNQFKDVFVGVDNRPYNRAVSIQKCLRAGGKHNDLENVGFTARHHTFFEMMGNFSFGDYFKKDAIRFAWEFLTKELAIPKDRLYVTVFETDDEAAEIWHRQEGVPKDRISRYGEKDNFWRMGQTGPCGPCSEIFYDHRPGEKVVPIDQDEDRFVEIWNLVFMQYFEDESGKQTPLPAPSVDTGAGLDRIAALMQGFEDNYQNDMFEPLMDRACKVAGMKYDWSQLQSNPEQLGALKVVADHARAATFLIGEGVLPSNEGRGYVLRRIMRRAIRYGRKLNESESIYPEVCKQVIKTMDDFYPELKKKKDFIINSVKDEEKRFLQTLDYGSDILNQHIHQLKTSKETTVNGKMAFTLYDTYGFPLDLTEVIAKEHKLNVDTGGFEKYMAQAKDKAKKAHKGHKISSGDRHFGEWTGKVSKKHGPTEFVGYDKLEKESSIYGLSDGSQEVKDLGGSGWMILKTTPFYAEGGGQVGDRGTFQGKSGSGEITNCIKLNDVFLHEVTVKEGSLKSDEKVMVTVDGFARQETANNHSATHLLHAALKKVLGDHVKQAGSLVNPQKLRFDFSHNQPVTEQELQTIESLVNQQIANDLVTEADVMPYQKAVDSGAVAMFGEKYGDKVRVVTMGEFSKELCGGTHVSRSSQIRLFKIFSETGVSAGVRRIEAITGRSAFIYLNGLAEENKQARRKLNVALPNNFLEGLDQKLSDKVDGLVKEKQNLEKEMQKLKSSSISIDDLLKQAEEKTIKGQKGLTLLTEVPVAERKVLSEIVDRLRDKNKTIVVVLIGEGTQQRPMIVGVGKDLKNVHAGQITKELCAVMGGKGGGRPDFSQGSISDIGQFPQAKEKFYELIQ